MMGIYETAPKPLVSGKTQSTWSKISTLYHVNWFYKIQTLGDSNRCHEGLSFQTMKL